MLCTNVNAQRVYENDWVYQLISEKLFLNQAVGEKAEVCHMIVSLASETSILNEDVVLFWFLQYRNKKRGFNIKDRNVSPIRK